MARSMYCPFIVTDYFDKRGENRISCEHGKLCFHDRESFDCYVNDYCGNKEGWERCTIAINLIKYYDRKE